MGNYSKGQVLSIAGHVGVVVEVYRADNENTPPVLKMDFVKNSIRQTGTELVDMDTVPDRAVSLETAVGLLCEWNELQKRQHDYVDALIKKTCL